MSVPHLQITGRTWQEQAYSLVAILDSTKDCETPLVLDRDAKEFLAVLLRALLRLAGVKPY